MMIECLRREYFGTNEGAPVDGADGIANANLDRVG